MINPFTLTPDDLDRLGTLVDNLDNAYHATKIPMSPGLHVQGLTGTVTATRDELKAFLKERFAYDPWDE